MDSNKVNADKEMKQQGNKDLDQKPNAAVGEKLTLRKKMGTRIRQSTEQICSQAMGYGNKIPGGN